MPKGSAGFAFAVCATTLALTSCVTPEELRREDEATCVGYGFRPDTDAFAACLQRDSLARRLAISFAPPAPYWGYWGRWWGPYWAETQGSDLPCFTGSTRTPQTLIRIVIASRGFLARQRFGASAAGDIWLTCPG